MSSLNFIIHPWTLFDQLVKSTEKAETFLVACPSLHRRFSILRNVEPYSPLCSSIDKCMPIWSWWLLRWKWWRRRRFPLRWRSRSASDMRNVNQLSECKLVSSILVLSRSRDSPCQKFDILVCTLGQLRNISKISFFRAIFWSLTKQLLWWCWNISVLKECATLWAVNHQNAVLTKTMIRRSLPLERWFLSTFTMPFKTMGTFL